VGPAQARGLVAAEVRAGEELARAQAPALRAVAAQVAGQV